VFTFTKMSAFALRIMRGTRLWLNTTRDVTMTQTWITSRRPLPVSPRPPPVSTHPVVGRASVGAGARRLSSAPACVCVCDPPGAAVTCPARRGCHSCDGSRTQAHPLKLVRSWTRARHVLAFTRYCFTLRLLCINQASSHCPLPPALPALLQYYCTSIAQYTMHPRPLVYVMHYTILVIAISCKSQATPRPNQTVYLPRFQEQSRQATLRCLLNINIYSPYTLPNRRNLNPSTRTRPKYILT